ncbi:unnamed protein product [Gadus morhua 'NCC']
MEERRQGRREMTSREGRRPGKSAGVGGIYQAVDVGGEEDKVIAEYNVTVQERVSPVVLKGLSGSPSLESCNVTVTCSTLSYSLNSTFTCTNQTCSGDGGDTAEVMTPDVLLQLYLSNGLNAICNHSNKVSWSNATMEIKPLCFEDDVIPHTDHHQRKKIIIISSCLVCFIILGCILVALYKRRKKNKRNINSRGSDDRSPNGDQSPTVYKAEIIADYHVTVQERVSPVVLNVSSVSLSPESCKVTVTCSTQSSSLNSTFTCTNQTCSEDGGDPAEVVTSDAPLNLYLSNGSITICYHSNKVSWSKATMEMKSVSNLCFKEAVFPDNNSNYEKLIILCRSVLVIPIIIWVIFYCWRKKSNHRKGHSDQRSNCDQAAAVYMNKQENLFFVGVEADLVYVQGLALTGVWGSSLRHF